MEPRGEGARIGRTVGSPSPARGKVGVDGVVDARSLGDSRVQVLVLSIDG